MCNKLNNLKLSQYETLMMTFIFVYNLSLRQNKDKLSHNNNYKYMCITIGG